MPETIHLNGIAVSAMGVYPRTVPNPDGPPLAEVSLVVILRGRLPNRDFVAMLAGGQVEIGLAGAPPFQALVTAATHASSGTSESDAYRHDLTLRETPSSAVRRAAIREAEAETAAQAVADAAAAAKPDPYAGKSRPPGEEDQFASGRSQLWATALRQLRTPDPAEADLDDAPAVVPSTAPTTDEASGAELAGIESVLVGLRLEALIETLDRRSVIRRSEVDDAFLRLIEERFVAEATPVVGADAATRALAGLLGG